MLDIQAIIDRHLTDEKMQGKTFYEGHIVVDLYNAIEEIKELRAALTTMQGAYELGVDTERAAVVALVNERAEKIRFTLAERSIPLLKDILYCIERGEHLKESS
jgi:ribose 5-phosphate isomerase